MPRNYNALQRLLAGNNYDNLPTISAGNVGYTPVVFQPTSQYTPSQVDTSILERSLGKIEERKLAVTQQKAAIKSAINKVALNEADANWRNEYVDKISSQIDAAAATGDYSTALQIATNLAADAATSPELLAREQENKRYETWRQNINQKADSGLIDTVTRDRLLAQNKYKSIPVESNGVVTGMKNWLDYGGRNGGAVEAPVNKTPITQSLILADKLYKERIIGGNRLTFKDSQGNDVNYYSPTVAGQYSSNTQTNYKDEKLLKQIFDEVFRQDRNAGAYVQQMYRDALWELETKEKEYKERINNGESPESLQDVKGRVDELKKEMYDDGITPISLPRYFQKLTEKSIEGLSYRNTISRSDASVAGSKNSKNDDESENPEEHIAVTGNGGTLNDNKKLSFSFGNAGTEGFNYLETQGQQTNE